MLQSLHGVTHAGVPAHRLRDTVQRDILVESVSLILADKMSKLVLRF